MIYRLGEHVPATAGDEYYVAPSAAVIGRVRLGRWASVWFGAVMRGDNDWLELGEGSNLQDGSVMHTDAGTALIVGRNVTVGHLVLLHKCTIGDDCLIGNQAMVLDGAVVGNDCIVAAGSLVPPRRVLPDGVVVMGSPAKVVRELTDDDRTLIRHGAAHYVANARRFAADLKPDGRP